MRQLYWVGFLAAVPLLTARAASAGGGGLVTAPRTPSSRDPIVTADTQRIVLALHDEDPAHVTTDVVVQVGVPATFSDYGVLIPVPSEPMLDPEPLTAADLDVLDEATRPHIGTVSGYEPPFSDDGPASTGCACVEKADSRPPPPEEPPPHYGYTSFHLSAPVNLGPVSAVVLGGDDGSALTGWLAANDFGIPPEQQPLIDHYVALGDRFIALTRSSTSADTGPSSVGIHYTLDGDQRELSLAFARLGAAPSVTFSVFVGGHTPLEPAPPFSTVAFSLAHPSYQFYGTSYEGGIENQYFRPGSRMFLLERTSDPPIPGLTERMLGILGTNVVSRLETILDTDALVIDVRVDVPAESEDGDLLFYRSAGLSAHGPHASVGALALVYAARALRRRLRAKRSGQNAA